MKRYLVNLEKNVNRIFELLKSKDFTRFYPFIFALVSMLILFQYSFSNIESVLYDLRARLDLGFNFEDNVVIVTLDEESDEFLGEQYPYTFAGHTRFLKKILNDSPLVINYFVHFNEPGSSRDEDDAKEFKDHVEYFQKNGGAFRIGTGIDEWGERLPIFTLKTLGFSSAIINEDSIVFARDGVSRRALLNISGEDTLYMWTANKYREKIGLRSVGVDDLFGSYYYREADATFALYRYYTSPLETNGKVSKIPFHRALVGNFPKGFFTNKIVLVGPEYVSNSSDFVRTPYSRETLSSSKLMVYAEIIQAIINKKTVYQVPQMVSYALALIITTVLSFIVARIRPTNGLLISGGVLLGILLVGYLAFIIFGIWIYLTHLIFSVFVVYYVYVPFIAIAEYQRRYTIQEETKMLKKVENLKHNFISLMSHDLKTPVAKIAGMADNMLNQSGANEFVRKGLFGIIEATKELNNFITTILDVTKIESRNLTLQKVSKDINQIIESVLEKFKFEKDDRKVEITTDLSPLYPIEIDVDLMKRVISNLVENAIKYSGANSIVEVKSWDDAEWIYISIKDNGVGIPPEDIDHVFEKFYRVKNDASHSIKGTGLGLYLVRYFVELHGGTIEVKSTLGEGALFLIKLKNM